MDVQVSTLCYIPKRNIKYYVAYAGAAIINDKETKKSSTEKSSEFRFWHTIYEKVSANVKILGDSHYKNKKYCSCFSKK